MLGNIVKEFFEDLEKAINKHGAENIVIRCYPCAEIIYAELNVRGDWFPVTDEYYMNVWFEDFCPKLEKFCNDNGIGLNIN